MTVQNDQCFFAIPVHEKNKIIWGPLMSYFGIHVGCIPQGRKKRQRKKLKSRIKPQKNENEQSQIGKKSK